jgi:hypothetical protein
MKRKPLRYRVEVELEIELPENHIPSPGVIQDCISRLRASWSAVTHLRLLSFKPIKTRTWDRDKSRWRTYHANDKVRR